MAEISNQFDNKCIKLKYLSWFFWYYLLVLF